MDRTVGTFLVVSSDCVNCEKRPCGEVDGDEREKWLRTVEKGLRSEGKDLRSEEKR